MSIDFNTPINLDELATRTDLVPGLFEDLDATDEARSTVGREDIFNDILDVPSEEPKKKKGRPKKEIVKSESIVAISPNPSQIRPKRSKDGKRNISGLGAPEVLSDKDKDYIGEHARKLSVQQMATDLDKKYGTVFRFMEKHGLLGEEDKRDARKKKSIINELHNYPFWETILLSYSDREVKYFEEEWYAFMMQLDDNIQATERVQLRQLIEAQLKIDRLSINERQVDVAIEELENAIEELRYEYNSSDDEDEKDTIKRQIDSCLMEQAAKSQSKVVISRDLDTYSKAQSRLMNELNVTRAKRVEKLDMSDKTWAKMLLDIKENPRLKKQLNAEAYVSWIATARMKAKLSKPYTFADGETHAPMLLPEGEIYSELGDMIEELYVPKGE